VEETRVPRENIVAVSFIGGGNQSTLPQYFLWVLWFLPPIKLTATIFSLGTLVSSTNKTNCHPEKILWQSVLLVEETRVPRENIVAVSFIGGRNQSTQRVCA
jgi:hypothetical protein